MSTESISGPMTCPQCQGTGQVSVTEQGLRKFLEILDGWAALRDTSNEDLADMVSEVQNYLRHRDLSPLVFTWLHEVRWRLQAAAEPIEETRRKIEALSGDEEWLAK